MSAGIKANNDGSAAIQVGGVDRVTLSSAGVMEVPAGIVANLTGAADKLSTASGSAPSYAARAWVNFDGTGTFSPNPSTTKIRASGNVSSITDNGTGDYTVNFTTAMPDANYSMIGTSSLPSGGSDRRIVAINLNTAPTTSAVRISVGYGAIADDQTYVQVAIHR